MPSEKFARNIVFRLERKLKNNVYAVPKNIRNLGRSLFPWLENVRLQYLVTMLRRISEDERIVERKFHISKEHVLL